MAHKKLSEDEILLLHALEGISTSWEKEFMAANELVEERIHLEAKKVLRPAIEICEGKKVTTFSR